MKRKPCPLTNSARLKVKGLIKIAEKYPFWENEHKNSALSIEKLQKEASSGQMTYKKGTRVQIWAEWAGLQHTTCTNTLSLPAKVGLDIPELKLLTSFWLYELPCMWLWSLQTQCRHYLTLPDQVNTVPQNILNASSQIPI